MAQPRPFQLFKGPGVSQSTGRVYRVHTLLLGRSWKDKIEEGCSSEPASLALEQQWGGFCRAPLRPQPTPEGPCPGAHTQTHTHKRKNKYRGPDRAAAQGRPTRPANPPPALGATPDGRLSSAHSAPACSAAGSASDAAAPGRVPGAHPPPRRWRARGKSQAGAIGGREGPLHPSFRVSGLPASWGSTHMRSLWSKSRTSSSR